MGTPVVISVTDRLIYWLIFKVYNSLIYMDRLLSKEEIRGDRRKMILKIAIPVVAVVISALFLSMLISRSIKKESLVFSTVKRGDISLSYTAQGVIVPAFEEIINSPINSKIIEIYHKTGDLVEAGTPLLKLDLMSAQADVKKMEDEVEMKRFELEQVKLNGATQISNFKMRIKVAIMRLNRSAVEWKNEKYLDSLGSGTTDKVREAEMNYNTGNLELQQLKEEYENAMRVKEADIQAKKLEYGILLRNLNEIRRTLTDAQIRAPRRAVLSFINNQIGAQVSQGSKIAVISDLNHFKIDCSISDMFASNALVGSRVMVKINGEKRDGFITNVDPLSRNGMVNFTVRLENDNGESFRSGAKVEVYVLGQQHENVLRIANNSYYTQAGNYELFVLEGNRIVKRRVVLGDSSYEYVEVISGLKEGEKVVVSDMSDYKKNKSIKIK